MSMFLSCHVRVSEWIHTLYLPECQGTNGCSECQGTNGCSECQGTNGCSLE